MGGLRTIKHLELGGVYTVFSELYSRRFSASVSPQVSSAIASGTTAFARPQHVNPFAQLYVADGCGDDVSMYARGRSRPSTATFSTRARKQNLYVASAPDSGNGSVTEYSYGDHSLVR